MTDQEQPRIIVDDDWKEQVQREKEQLAAGTKAPRGEEHSHPMPEASFVLLVTTLVTQTLAALGFIADPSSGPSEPNLPMAKHFVDLLTVLQEKTRGNLSADESQLLEESLHQLRMAYVTSDGARTAGPPMDQLASRSSIELP